MKETWRKLDGFGFSQWFGLVCYATAGAVSGAFFGFFLGAFVSEMLAQNPARIDNNAALASTSGFFVGALLTTRNYRNKR